MQEMYLSLYNEGKLTQEDLALALDLTIMKVRQELFKAGCKLSSTVTPEWTMEVAHLNLDGTLEEQARQYCVDMLTYRRLKYQVSSTRFTVDRTDLKLAINAGDKTQAELAEEYGVSQATVSRHNPKRKKLGPYRKRVTAFDMAKVKKYLETHTVSDAARHFGISRQTIYRKLNNDN